MKSPYLIPLIALVGLSLAGCASKTNDSPVTAVSGDLLIAFGSCNNHNGSQEHWNQILKREPDLMILMGDNVYPEKSSDLHSLEKAYASLTAHPDFQKFRSKVPLMGTWDDEDFGENDAGADFRFKEQSKNLFLDFFREPKNSARRDREGVYEAAIIGEPGQRVQIILLDTRSFRSALKKVSPRPERKGPYVPNEDPEAQILGETQWKWLEKQLQQAADLRIIVSSIQVLAEETGWEAWSNFPAERQRLLNLIATTKAENLIFLSGDRHHASLWRLRNTKTYPLFEATSSSLNAPLPLKYQYQPDSKNRLGPVDHSPNFGLLEVDWERSRIEFLIVDAQRGSILQSRSLSLRELSFYR